MERRMKNIFPHFKRLRISIVHMRLLAALCLPFLLSACGEQKCGVPGIGNYYQCFYYYTDDMSETKIEFAPSRYGQRSTPFSIPKAYIITALPYAENEVPVLPDVIMPKSLTLLMTYPSGLPLKVARNGNKREVDYTVNLRPNYSGSNTAYENFRCKSGEGEPPIKLVGIVNTYKHYENCPHTSEYVLDNTNLGRAISCPTPEKDARPGMLCVHSIRLRPGLEAEVYLPDFRATNGLVAAEKQVAVLLKTLCPMVGCDAQYTDYFYNLETK
jgi:hypothetical protein